MKNSLLLSFVCFCLLSCQPNEYTKIPLDNSEIELSIPSYFPELNPSYYTNKPTKYGTLLGEKLFYDTRLSKDNTISCSSCHQQSAAFADNNKQAIGINGRVGMRNTPPIQNLTFMQFYNWDGNKLSLESQPLVPIITHEEMDSSILEVIEKIQNDKSYIDLFQKAFGTPAITGERIYKSIAQYEYTLISTNSKYDQVMQNKDIIFSTEEGRGYAVFQQKCISCHSTALFTDQSFRNIGFPINPNKDEGGRARVTGVEEDYLRFRVPSLRDVEYTAPYGSFGQFATLKEVLDYLDTEVEMIDNLDPILKENQGRIPLTEQEKNDLIAFMKTLSDKNFIGK